MARNHRTVVGIDVGGRRKGYHAVALRNGQFESQRFTRASDVADWCESQDAKAVSIDAPCAWASSGGSRLAERSLSMGGETIQCFKTPTRTSANGRAFYDWVFNGEKLYQVLFAQFRLYDGKNRRGRIVLETFPHAVVCFLAGRLVPARPKAATRRGVLRAEGYSDQQLASIDFVDAALCALTAERFISGRTLHFGDIREGLIVVPTRPRGP